MKFIKEHKKMTTKFNPNMSLQDKLEAIAAAAKGTPQSNNNDLPWFESKTNDIEKIQVLDNTTKDKKNSKWFGIF